MKKTFQLADVLTLTTGRLLTDFHKLHELAEHIAGHPIWTHEFADKKLCDRLRERVFEQYPALRDALMIPIQEGVDPAVIRLRIHEYLKENQEKFGAEFEFEQGGETRTENPIESLQRIAPGKPVLAVVVEDK